MGKWYFWDDVTLGTVIRLDPPQTWPGNCHHFPLAQTCLFLLFPLEVFFVASCPSRPMWAPQCASSEAHQWVHQPWFPSQGSCVLPCILFLQFLLREKGCSGCQDDLLPLFLDFISLHAECLLSDTASVS